jgi:hypothetical protein
MLGFFSSFPTEKKGEPLFEKLWEKKPTMMENIYRTSRGDKYTGHCALKGW